MSDNKPVNFETLAESFELAMKQHDDVPDNAASDIIDAVEEACANNERMLVWEDDYEEFLTTLDGILDGIYHNGYEEPVKQLDDLRAKMDATSSPTA